MRSFECVIRRRHRMGTEIAAVGPMTWDDEERGYMFRWPIPADYQPSPFYVVEIDVFEHDVLVVHHSCLRLLHAEDEFPVRYRGHDDDNAGEPQDDPTRQPGIALLFDPDDLLRAPDCVGAR